MQSVAAALGEALCGRVVFIGAAVLPLLETDEVLGAPRPTKDVDGVIATTTYVQKAHVEEEMRARRFRHVQEPPTHLDRWRAPDPQETVFDLVGCGDHPGGTGNAHDQWVIDTAITADLPPHVRHASAVGLLLLKCDAYEDRGKGVPLQSKDLADIVALCATRPSLVGEVAEAPVHVRNAIGAAIRSILNTPRERNALVTHVEDRQPLVPDLLDVVEERFRALAAFQGAEG